MVSGAAAQQLASDGTACVATIAPRWAYCTPRHIADGAPRLSIRAGHIHLWAVDLAALQSQPHRALLSASELARAGRYRNRAQCAMYLGGRVGLRLLLHAYTGIANNDLRFTQNARGKPSLANTLPAELLAEISTDIPIEIATEISAEQPTAAHTQSPGGELCFNYTLSGGRALYAFAWNRQVGIDMETSPRKINAAQLARRKLAPLEQCAWRALPAKWRDWAMLACWTRKESFGKALGVGLRYHMNQVPLFVAPHAPTWQCEVTGLFASPPISSPTSPPAKRTPRILHGIQLALPFPGVAALMHDGDALLSPAAGESLRGWRLRVDSLSSPAMLAADCEVHEIGRS